MENYFRDINSLITNEFAYDRLADRCTNLKNQINNSQGKETQDILQKRFEKLECDEHKNYSNQTNLVRNTVGARTILALNELTDKKNKTRIEKFIETAGICGWIDKKLREENGLNCTE